MTRPPISQALFWILALVTLALFGFFVALVAGAIPVGEPAPPRDSEALQTETGDQPAATTATKRVQRTGPAASTTTPSSLATVVVTAARGDCWISARLGSENGRVLEERLLAQGESVTLRAARVWMSIGAASNVDVTVNGKDRELQPGTVAVVLGPT